MVVVVVEWWWWWWWSGGGGTVLYCVQTLRLVCAAFYWCFNALPTNPVSTGVSHSIGAAIKEKAYLREYRNQERVGPSYAVRRPRYVKGTMSVNIGLSPRKFLELEDYCKMPLEAEMFFSLVRFNRKMSPGHIYAT